MADHDHHQPSSPSKLISLEERWHHWTGGLGGPEGGAQSKWWAQVKAHYDEAQRSYHTLRHLDSMFQHFDRVVTDLRRPQLVALSIFFHDIIYDPKSRTNEEDSATCFQEFAQEVGLPEAEVTVVVEWILATKSHQASTRGGEGGEEGGDQDLPLFLDMDMSILGVDQPDYMVYAAQVREEYIHVPEEAYCKGRASVLETFLQQPRIYSTERFHEELEAKARHNLEAEIALLQSGKIPKLETA